MKKTFLLLFLNSFVLAAQEFLPESTPKYKEALGVFNILSHSFANGLSEPKLLVAAKGKKKYMARYVPAPSPAIIVDEEVIDVCKSFGQNYLSAMALVIGHEMAHYYRKDAVFDTYGMAHNQADKLRSSIEAMADYEACYHAAINNFDAGIFPDLLDALYKEYRLAENINGYHPKARRKLVFEEKKTEIGYLETDYHLGNAAYILKDFKGATDHFERIKERFPGKNILLNLGAAYLQQGLADTRIERQLFILPVEFNITERLAAQTRGVVNDDNLKKAIGIFERLIAADKSFQTARINLACAYLAQEKYHSAIHAITQSAALSPDDHTVLGIAFFNIGQPDKAKSHFKKAYDGSARGAAYNYELFSKNESWWYGWTQYYREIKRSVEKYFENEEKPKAGLISRFNRLNVRGRVYQNGTKKLEIIKPEELLKKDKHFNSNVDDITARFGKEAYTVVLGTNTRAVCFAGAKQTLMAITNGAEIRYWVLLY